MEMSKSFRVSVISLTALASLLLSSCEQNQRVSGANVNRIGIEEFARLMEQPGGCVLLDVRSPVEFSKGHIPGAKNLDVSSDAFESEMSQLDPDARYLVYCHSGGRSRRACGMMEAAGFIDLHELGPGFSGWASSGKPVER